MRDWKAKEVNNGYGWLWQEEDVSRDSVLTAHNILRQRLVVLLSRVSSSYRKAKTSGYTEAKRLLLSECGVIRYCIADSQRMVEMTEPLRILSLHCHVVVQESNNQSANILRC